jgi:RimJ/RimL family protein N-acetyltransferase
MNVTLRGFKDSDYDAFAQCHGPQGLNALVPQNEETCRNYFNFCRKDVNHWTIDMDGQWVGQISFKSPKNDRVAEVSYTVSPFHQRKGIATRALAQLIDQAFGNGGASYGPERAS